RARSDVELLPAIPDPEKILCAGINYRSHAAETGRELPKQPSMFLRLANTLTGHEGELVRPSVSRNFDFAGEARRELPKQPSMFLRLANTLPGHEGELVRPSVSRNFDFEGELAVVIG